MVGDGVNDVPALKAARLAIAQGSGTQMARSVADVVLVSGDFAAVPAMVEEGRKILRNVQRVAKLFVTKSAFAAFLDPLDRADADRLSAAAAASHAGRVAHDRHPRLLPRPRPELGPRTRSEGFLRELARFALPAGTAAGLGVVSSYLFALNVLDLPLESARTVAVTVVVLVGLYLLLALEASGGKRSAAVSLLCLDPARELRPGAGRAIRPGLLRARGPDPQHPPPGARRRGARDRRTGRAGRPLRTRQIRLGDAPLPQALGGTRRVRQAKSAHSAAEPMRITPQAVESFGSVTLGIRQSVQPRLTICSSQKSLARLPAP